MRPKITFFRKRSALVLAAALAVGCLRNPVSNRRQAKLISEKAEREIGLQTRNELVKEYGALEDPVLQEYVARVGRRLTEVSDRPRLEYAFTIIDTDMVNAFAAPGGFIFVTRGLLERMDSEAELATVLGHEIGHVCAWHSIAMIQREMGTGILATLGAIASGFTLGPEVMVAVAQTADLFSGLYMLGYSRENELEADRVGLRYALSAGYEARAAISFFNKLRALEIQADDDAWEPYLRSHPPTEDRIALADRYLDGMGGYNRPSPVTAGAFQAQKERLPRLPPEDRGRIEGRRFVHPALGISLEIPDGWTWELHNQQVLASFQSPKGGAWGELRRKRLDAPLTADGFARKLASDRRWRPVAAREVLYPAGYAVLGHFYGAGTLGGGYQLRVLFVVREKIGYALICGAPPDKAEDFLLPFEQIMRSFKLP